MQKGVIPQRCQILMQGGDCLHILPGTLMPLCVFIRRLSDFLSRILHFFLVQACSQIHKLLGHQRILCLKHMGCCAVHDHHAPILQHHCIQRAFVRGAVIQGNRLPVKGCCHTLHQRGFSGSRSTLEYVGVEAGLLDLFGKSGAESAGGDSAEKIRLLHNVNLPSDMFYLMQNRLFCH